MRRRLLALDDEALIVPPVHPLRGLDRELRSRSKVPPGVVLHLLRGDHAVGDSGRRCRRPP
jgi:hypothetical protein